MLCFPKIKVHTNSSLQKPQKQASCPNFFQAPLQLLTSGTAYAQTAQSKAQPKAGKPQAPPAAIDYYELMEAINGLKRVMMGRFSQVFSFLYFD